MHTARTFHCRLVPLSSGLCEKKDLRSGLFICHNLILVHKFAFEMLQLAAGLRHRLDSEGHDALQTP